MTAAGSSPARTWTSAPGGAPADEVGATRLQAMQALVRAAAMGSFMPVALLSLVEDGVPRLAAAHGMPRPGGASWVDAVAAHVLAADGVLEVLDTAADPRFADTSRLADHAGAPGVPAIRSYAGTAIRLADGSRVGALCVAGGSGSRLDREQRELLRCLAIAASGFALGFAEAPAAEGATLPPSDVIAAAGVATWEWDLPTGALTCNQAWFAMLGRGRAGAPPAGSGPWVPETHPDDLARARRLLEAHLAGDSASYACDLRMRHADGSWIWVLQQGGVVRRDAGGRAVRLAGIQRDITHARQQQDALLACEDMLERIGRQAGIGAWELELGSGRLTWSAEACRIHGLAPGHRPSWDEALGLYVPEMRAALQEACARCAAGGGGWDMELKLRRDDGRLAWVRMVGGAVAGPGLPRLAGTVQDVTAQLDQRGSLQAANERLALATGGGIGIWDWDPAADRFTWDSRVGALHGLEAADATVPTPRWLERLHPDDREPVRQALRTTLEDGAPYDVQYRVSTADGGLRHLRATAHRGHGADGQGARVAGVLWDVSAARDLTAALARQHELLRVTLRSIGEGVITSDAAGRVVWLNPVAERMTGWTMEEAAGRPVTEVFRTAGNADDDAPSPAVVPHTAPRGGPGAAGGTGNRTRLLSRHGASFGIEQTTSPIRNEACEVLGAVLVVHDVTEQRRVAAMRAGREAALREANAELERLARHLAVAKGKADQASRAKSRFLAGMSHELRTPLNGILGYAELLRMEGGLSEVQAARVESMMDAGAHLMDMITSVLDLSEIEAERVQLRAERLDAAELVAACVRQVLPAAAAKGLSVQVEAAEGAKLELVADATRLRQVLLNLLGNAVKFTDAGSVHVRVRPAGAGGALRIEVADTGRGIPPAQRQNLFREFERLDQVGTAPVQGAGLGLAVAAQLVKLMGGRLGHADGAAGGSVFWLEMPLGSGADLFPTLPASTGAERPAGRGAERLRVLVVDDMTMNREIASAFLTAAGHEVTCAEGGAQAVEMVARGAFDVVLMDVRMPEMDGLEATRRIRALGGAAAETPIVGVTAQAFAEQVEDCVKAGMDGHLGKPYTAMGLCTAATRAHAQRRKDRPVPPAVPVTAAPAPAPIELAGAELETVDPGMAGQVDGFLPPAAVAAYLDTIAARGQAVLVALRAAQLESWTEPGWSDPGSAGLSDAIHALVGSAGMFGFLRLATVGRDLEATLRAGGPVPQHLADGMVAAIEATMAAIAARERVAVPSG